MTFIEVAKQKFSQHFFGDNVITKQDDESGRLFIIIETNRTVDEASKCYNCFMEWWLSQPLDLTRNFGIAVHYVES